MMHLPHPSAKHSINSSVVLVQKELELNDNFRRIVIEFVTDNRNVFGDDKNVGMYISQKGRATILYLDDKIYKVDRIKRMKSEIVRTMSPMYMIGANKRLKIDIIPIEISTSHFEALKRIVTQRL